MAVSAPGEHFHGRERIYETDQSAFAQGIEGDDGYTALSRFLQLMQHAWTVGADILSEKENTVGVFEVIQHHGAHRHT